MQAIGVMKKGEVFLDRGDKEGVMDGRNLGIENAGVKGQIRFASAVGGDDELKSFEMGLDAKGRGKTLAASTIAVQSTLNAQWGRGADTPAAVTPDSAAATLDPAVAPGSEFASDLSENARITGLGKDAKGNPTITIDATRPGENLVIGLGQIIPKRTQAQIDAGEKEYSHAGNIILTGTPTPRAYTDGSQYAVHVEGGLPISDKQSIMEGGIEFKDGKIGFTPGVRIDLQTKKKEPYTLSEFLAGGRLPKGSMLLGGENAELRAAPSRLQRLSNFVSHPIAWAKGREKELSGRYQLAKLDEHRRQQFEEDTGIFTSPSLSGLIVQVEETFGEGMEVINGVGKIAVEVTKNSLIEFSGVIGTVFFDPILPGTPYADTTRSGKAISNISKAAVDAIAAAPETAMTGIKYGSGKVLEGVGKIGLSPKYNLDGLARWLDKDYKHPLEGLPKGAYIYAPKTGFFGDMGRAMQFEAREGNEEAVKLMLASPQIVADAGIRLGSGVVNRLQGAGFYLGSPVASLLDYTTSWTDGETGKNMRMFALNKIYGLVDTENEKYEFSKTEHGIGAVISILSVWGVGSLATAPSKQAAFEILKKGSTYSLLATTFDAGSTYMFTGEIPSVYEISETFGSNLPLGMGAARIVTQLGKLKEAGGSLP
ncbi:MAG: hypothetical protein KAI61_05305, partial [Alphaproteobacteria bacterium]|nr:hypothetical protein [Alphaproteobacteria bacterium]